jgi:hypothetical protein
MMTNLQTLHFLLKNSSLIYICITFNKERLYIESAYNVVTCRPKVGIVKSEESSIARQPLGKHIPEAGNTQTAIEYARVEVFIAVTMKNSVFWDVELCRSCVNRRFGGTSIHKRSTQRHIPEDGILHSNRITSVAIQWRWKYAFTTIEETEFSVGPPRSYIMRISSSWN